ncbi:acyl carrier protein [Fulvivirgaceae bacterium BMA12]|uniref:Acyl carrier protein n=1 Tax=Agaribacillus aureus TaxID=3051825 RepID=A0ABT8L8W8_9BACT|nr:acyl carrier protein [Fulvivirgaceae bacterium BMA12]
MEIKESIRNYIKTELVNNKDHQALSDSDQLIESGVIDSLGIMKLIGFLEDNMSVQIDDMELVPENFSSIDAITSLVEKKIA